eukprot:231754-Prorocentrum_minimum.AAC.3
MKALNQRLDSQGVKGFVNPASGVFDALAVRRLRDETTSSRAGQLVGPVGAPCVAMSGDTSLREDTAWILRGSFRASGGCEVRHLTAP